MISQHAFVPAGRSRSGFSLLEVLVACGILMLALASIAAILPAAASRLGEATAYDRASATMEMAFSEIRSRGLASRDVFPSTSSTAAIVIGETLPLALLTFGTSGRYVVTSGSLTTTGTILGSGTLRSGSTQILTVSGPALAARVGNDLFSNDRRGYFLEDDVQYVPPVGGTLPFNAFTGATPIASGAGIGPRQFNRGPCWGAMIKPSPWGKLAGDVSALDVSVAVFRKPAEVISGTSNFPVVAMTLSGTTGESGVFQLSGTNTPGSLQRRFLRPCTYVLGIPQPAVSGTTSPRWLSIRSSWISGATPLTTVATATTCVIFEQPDLVLPLLRTSSAVTGTNITVLGFEHLLDVQERTMTIE